MNWMIIDCDGFSRAHLAYSMSLGNNATIREDGTSVHMHNRAESRFMMDNDSKECYLI